MSSTGLSRTVAISFFAFMSGAVTAAAPASPATLRDPVLGLRYEVATADFDLMPKDVLAKCPTLSNAHIENTDWIYALARDEGRTYYIIAGYGMLLHPSPPEFRRYVAYDLGTVFAVEGDECVIFGEAGETFDARYFQEISQQVLLKLANDSAARLARAFGGADRLSAQMHRQHVALGKLSPELNEAFAPYFRKAIRRRPRVR
ncbi:hypothetical protein [Rugamonas sp.]|uniref:hypothetical protein n=1 Tax=Rugamonas sp. TaxID=1926287 RepID=UPI0025D6B302|nr:hypothetical protein [Rugamonas sp.]